ncbi:MAG: ISLre2 family transposase, partial [Rudanella sp.]|nr:ISLre2 family transposase [Rudanella sp.]
MLTEDELVALTRQRYRKLYNLQQTNSFCEHEKQFEDIWMDLGREVLQQTISQPPEDRRKK